MAGAPGGGNILWSEKILKKGGKNTKKGVDKGLAVWYISKALGARGTAEAGRSGNIRGNRKKGLDKSRAAW